MRAILLIVSAILFLHSTAFCDETTSSFDSARTIAVRQDLPLLLEFHFEGCEYCELAAREAETEEIVKAALKRVVHLPLNVAEGEGVELAEQYRAGETYPVFILTNVGGEIISRFTGYTGAGQFVHRLNTSLKDLTTINDRVAAFELAPSYREALDLAQYFNDSFEYLKAVDYYRRAQTLTGRDFAYKIFLATVNAGWTGQTAFAQVLPSVDSALKAPAISAGDSIRIAQLTVKLARKLGATDQVAGYLQAGLKAGADSKAPKDRDALIDLRADSALYIALDTAGAVELKRKALDSDWQTNPDKFYAFSKWCLERKINLEEAERWTREVWGRAAPGKFKARVLSTLASIREARGDIQEAIYFMELAIEEDSRNSQLAKQLDRYWEQSSGR